MSAKIVNSDIFVQIAELTLQILIMTIVSL
jgi:hypothetical protein